MKAWWSLASRVLSTVARIALRRRHTHSAIRLLKRPASLWYMSPRCTRALRRAARPRSRRNRVHQRYMGTSMPRPPPSYLPATFRTCPMDKARISIDEFAKIEVRVGTVQSAERVPETDKLLQLTVDFGEETGPRQIVSGIATYVPEPGSLVGRQLAFVTNLEPRIIKGLESNGMLFAVGEGDSFAFLAPDRDVPPGA